MRWGFQIPCTFCYRGLGGIRSASAQELHLLLHEPLSKEPKVQEWGFGSMGEDSTSCNYRQSTGLHIFITNDFFKHDELHWKYNHYMSSIWGRMSDYNHKYNNIINLAWSTFCFSRSNSKRMSEIKTMIQIKLKVWGLGKWLPGLPEYIPIIQYIQYNT